MSWLAITRETAEWLLGQGHKANAVERWIGPLNSSKALRKAVLTAGPLRFAATSDGNITAVWHSDYLGATGEECWGFLRLQGQHGFLSSTAPSDYFKSVLQVMDARLHNFLLPDNKMVRAHGGGAFTCVVGQGKNKQISMGYLEVTLASAKAILVVGPELEEGELERSLARLVETLTNAAKPNVERLAQAATRLLQDARRRPAVDDRHLVGLRDEVVGVTEGPELAVVQPKLQGSFAEPSETLDYAGWTSDDGPLSLDKRTILEGDYLERQPLRIIGPAGSGKTLLMQLMAVRTAEIALRHSANPNILYLVHNSSMRRSVQERFSQLWKGYEKHIHVLTLMDYCIDQLGIDASIVLDRDSWETKKYQALLVLDGLRKELADVSRKDCPLLWQATQDEGLLEAVVILTVAEIGVVIKAHRLFENPRRYVDSERSLSRFHGLLTRAERGVILQVFERYHREVFEEGGQLDVDDVAITVLNKLRTPLWALQRRQRGFDYVFIDEAQLYNENERRVFPFLTKKHEAFLPIAISLDEAQNLASSQASGFAALGLQNLQDESLRAVYRCTESILRLAFHVIQRTTDLFGAEFPDFTMLSKSCVNVPVERAPKPKLHSAEQGESLGEAVTRIVTGLRSHNFRRIGVIVHSERYFDSIKADLGKSGLPMIEVAQRGQRLDSVNPLVAVMPPRLAGGQEFDAVVAAGIEQGVVPPPVNVEGLAVSLEQQALRELYLSFTRAKLQLHLVQSHGATPSALLQSAITSGLLDVMPESA